MSSLETSINHWPTKFRPIIEFHYIYERALLSKHVDLQTGKMEGMKRAWIGTIIHAITVLYLYIWPLYILIRLCISEDGFWEAATSLRWTTYLSLGIMIFVASCMVLGLIKPLSKWVRLSVAAILGSGAVIWIFDLIYETLAYGAFDPSVSASLVIVTILSVGFFLGYESKAAFILLPFQADKEPKQTGYGGGDGNAGTSSPV